MTINENHVLIHSLDDSAAQLKFGNNISFFCVFYLRKVNSQDSSTASGFIIKDKWILSNAHAVSNQCIIRIRKHGDPKKYPGRIVHIAHECDLVIMTVDDNTFWEKVHPLTFSNRVPKLQESITVVGYPIGNNNLHFFLCANIIHICSYRW